MRNVTDQSGEFDWHHDSVVAKEQMATAVYSNVDGDIVIRQRTFEFEDCVIVVTPRDARNVAHAILQLADGIKLAG
jgi:hypothetical protein